MVIPRTRRVCLLSFLTGLFVMVGLLVGGLVPTASAQELNGTSPPKTVMTSDGGGDDSIFAARTSVTNYEEVKRAFTEQGESQTLPAQGEGTPTKEQSDHSTAPTPPQPQATPKNETPNDPQTDSSLVIHYDKPTSQGTLIPNRTGAFGTTSEDNRWQQLTLPIGNSYMGANVYGEISQEHLTFNHKTLWNGGPSPNRPNYNGGNITTVDGMPMADYVKKVQEAFLKGDPNAAAMADRIVGSKDGYGSYQAFGDIYLNFHLNGEVTNYQRTLNLNNETATVDFDLNGTHYHREYLASYPDNVLVIKLTADGKAKMNFEVQFPINNNTTPNLQKTYTTTTLDDTLRVAGYLNDNLMKFNGQIRAVPVDGTVAGDGSQLLIRDSSAVYLYITAGTDYKNVYPTYRTGESDEALNQRVSQVLRLASEKGYVAVKAAAIKDYQTIFNRVNLQLAKQPTSLTTDQLLVKYNTGKATMDEKRALETLLFQYGRYLQISSSRAGDLPANLQGVWSNRVGDETRVPWGSDYHMNVNLQMNYWPTYVTNMAETALPLIDYVDSLREPGRVTAEDYFGVISTPGHANGFTAHTQNTPFGWTAPGWAFSWGWSPAAVPWILQNVYEYYEYTGDKQFLQERIYPLLKEEVKLYQQILVEDPQTGRLETVPAYSPEHGPYTAGNTYEQSLIWQLFKDTIEAATALGVDQELVKDWQAIQAKLKPIEIGTDGQIKEWYAETTLGSISGSDRKHRHLSHLLGLFPGDLINIDNEAYWKAAIISLTDRGDDATGWGMGQRLNAWARLGDGNHAYKIIQAFFKNGAYPNLWDAHPPFQIDGNFGYTAGVAEMLLQSNLGYLNPLAALPDDWDHGHVSGLVGRGDFEVTLDWSNHQLTQAAILAKKGGNLSLQYENISQALLLDQNGQQVAFTVDKDNRITFPTVAGETYYLTQIPVRQPEQIVISAPSERVNLNETETLQLEASYAPIGSEGAGIVWSVANELGLPSQIATITPAGLLTVNGMGVVIVRAVDQANPALMATKTIQVVKAAVVTEKDDRDQSIHYSNGWAPWNEAKHENGTVTETTTKGANFSFDFTGNGVSLYFMKLEGNGVVAGANIEVFIDGKSQGIFSTYSTVSGSEPKAKVFESQSLAMGPHHVQVVVKDAPVAGVTPKVSFDYYTISTGTSEQPLDYTELKAAMAQFLKTDLTAYFKEDADQYRTAFKAAEKQYEVAADQATIDRLTATLLTANHALVNRDDYLKPLQALVAEVDQLDLTHYDDASRAALAQARQTAVAALNNADLTKREADNTRQGLQTAVDQLTAKVPETVDKQALVMLVNQGLQLDSRHYTQASFATVQHALRAAIALLHSDEVSAAAVAEATAALQAALDQLEPATQTDEPDVPGPGEQPDEPDVPGPGEQPEEPDVPGPGEQPDEPDMPGPGDQPEEPDVPGPGTQPDASENEQSVTEAGTPHTHGVVNMTHPLNGTMPGGIVITAMSPEATPAQGPLPERGELPAQEEQATVATAEPKPAPAKSATEPKTSAHEAKTSKPVNKGTMALEYPWKIIGGVSLLVILFIGWRIWQRQRHH